jgi:hypothetical protein
MGYFGVSANADRHVDMRLPDLMRRKIGTAHYFMRKDRAFRKIASICPSVANRPARMSASPRSIPARSSSLN